MKIKSILSICLCVGAFGISNANAGCLSGMTEAISIESKIKSFYLKSTYNDPERQYVILDEFSCLANPGNVTIAPTTAQHYYLQFDGEDKTILSALIAAQAQGTTVEFRIGGVDGTGGTTNRILYIISPAQ